MSKLHTSLNRLKLAGACGQRVGSGHGYDRLRQHLGQGWGKDDPVDLGAVLESNGLADTLWCLRATIEDYTTCVRPLVQAYLADVLEHLAAKLSGEAKALLLDGAALLRDGATSRAQLEHCRQRASAYASAAAAYASAAAADAAYAADAADAADAAADAAYAAERQWQQQRLSLYLTGAVDASQESTT